MQTTTVLQGGICIAVKLPYSGGWPGFGCCTKAEPAGSDLARPVAGSVGGDVYMQDSEPDRLRGNLR